MAKQPKLTDADIAAQVDALTPLLLQPGADFTALRARMMPIGNSPGGGQMTIAAVNQYNQTERDVKAAAAAPPPASAVVQAAPPAQSVPQASTVVQGAPPATAAPPASTVVQAAPPASDSFFSGVSQNVIITVVSGFILAMLLRRKDSK